MNTILLTGGAGHIGSHTFVALREADFEPVILDSIPGIELTALLQSVPHAASTAVLL